MKKIALLGIDLQNDFTSISGSLFVKGAEQDINNINRFIAQYGSQINYVALSLDSHQPIHIASQCYWKNPNGEKPELFSVISATEVADGLWIPQYNAHLALNYLLELEAKGEVCTIWPPHCILGSKGWAIHDTLINTLYKWSIEQNKSYELFYKGYNQATEHYSIFKAAVTLDNAPETQLNRSLMDKLNLFDEVLIVGEAADYCVTNSLNDIVDASPLLARKTTVLTDCMSWIIPDNPKAVSIFEKANQAGVTFTESTNYLWK